MHDGVTVREATVDDARGIARVLVDGWKTTYAGILPAPFLASFKYDDHEAGTRQHLENLPTSSAVFVALAEDGSVLGVVHVQKPAGGPKDFSAELDAIYVMPSAQRRHVGSRLFLTAVRWLREQGHRSMFLWVLRDNPYRPFYDRVGGELLNEQQQQDFGGVTVTSVAYGWRNLEILSGLT
jgi:GNAT superfamily N-acetyltransferase